MEMNRNKKLLMGCAGLLGVYLFSGNTNNSPELFIERVFRPLSGDNWTFHYAGIILIVLTYMSLDWINSYKENMFTKTNIRRFILTLVVMSVFSSMWGSSVRMYKAFANDLNAIYLERDETDINFNGNEKHLTVSGSIKVWNCSDKIQKFRVKVKAPSVIKLEDGESYIVFDEEFTLYPKIIDTLDVYKKVSVSTDAESTSYWSTGYEYVLYNDDSEVVFRGSNDDYKFR